MGLRQDRLADEIRDILAGCFYGGKMNDPRLQGVTITHVKVSSDLQVASVYFRLFDEKDKDVAQSGLEHCSGLLKKKLADVLRLRRVPALRFFYDESVETGARIESLLQKIKDS